jgi:hypothetical protein
MEDVDYIEMERVQAQIHRIKRRNKAKTTIDICRKGSIVKEKCKQLTETASRLFPDGLIKNTDLEALIEDYCGADKETVRAYLGYAGRIRRSKKTGEGYILGEKRRGYLEKFGFMHRIDRDTWRLNQQVLSAVSLCQNNESLRDNTMKKSLSLDSIKDNVPKDMLRTVFHSHIETAENIANKQNTEKERNFQHVPSQANNKPLLSNKIKSKED